MITRETINNIATAVFLSDIIDYIPMKAKVKRKTIEGIIQQNLPKRQQARLDISQYLNFDSNNEIISWFIDSLEQNFSHCDLTSLYTNIQTLKVVERRKTILDRLDEILRLSTTSAGTYNTRKNKIEVYSNKAYDLKDLESTKIHELVHFATTRKEGNMTLCGFERSRNNISFAAGLNEGYTEWFTRRYLLRTDGGSYTDLQTIASAIESLVGAEKVQQYFFTNNLEGLITDMEKYTTREQALALIEKMDRIHNSYGKPGGKLYREKIGREARVDVANMLISKSKKLFEEGKITEPNYKNSLFNIELFTHNYMTKFYGNEKEITNATISDYIQGYSRLDMSFNEYMEFRDKYYEDKKDNPTFTYKPWRNKEGLTLEESFDAITKEKKQVELNEMFKEQTSSSQAKTNTPKKW